MAHEDSETKPVLVFVYNAESGLFNTLGDVAHKILSPETYACNLCALTHTAFRVRREWTQFLESLDAHTEFLHADELHERYGLRNLPLPAILRRLHDASLEQFIHATAINSCRTLDELERLITDNLNKR
ncbi:MAG TPA: hypothetical protein VGW12_10540 [Pyrinomonadaceae bacterium]|nr:hypothetical protein [Pyrinomonadaceae bacterium]